ncbi:MAG: DUF1343 domain-containing protein [Clostridia bacterium]|nr:DUF1343 domain-containing protein [Clostridia bacterium]
MHYVKSGIDRLKDGEYISSLKGKRIGLITNPTGVDASLRSSIDILKEIADLKMLFAPEHGVRGDLQAGVKMSNYTDAKSGLPVFSLYGGVHHIPKELIETLDAVVFDVQDIGARFYTYMYTLSYVMEDCAEYGKEMIVLDRVNPIGGMYPEGTILDRKFSSFVGRFPTATRHNMTIGEFARYINDTESISCDLTVIPLMGWTRDMLFSDTSLPFVSPSPNIPTPDTCLCYIGTCLAEGTNLSEGRGTTHPFEFVGAPFTDGEYIADAMNEIALPGVIFRPCHFTPTFSKHQGDLCSGVQLHVTDSRAFKPFEAGLRLIDLIRKTSPDFRFRDQTDDQGRMFIDKLLGTDAIRSEAFDVDEFLKETEKPLSEYTKKINGYYLY